MTDPADPSNYKPHPLGYCCVDCNASAKLGQAVRHSSICDVAPREFVLPADQFEGAPSRRSQRRGTSANTKARQGTKAREQPSLAAAAKRGDARLHYTDDEIASGVRSRELTESDAMNQDF